MLVKYPPGLMKSAIKNGLDPILCAILELYIIPSEPIAGQYCDVVKYDDAFCIELNSDDKYINIYINYGCLCVAASSHFTDGLVFETDLSDPSLMNKFLPLLENLIILFLDSGKLSGFQVLDGPVPLEFSIRSGCIAPYV